MHFYSSSMHDYALQLQGMVGLSLPYPHSSAQPVHTWGFTASRTTLPITTFCVSLSCNKQKWPRLIQAEQQFVERVLDSSQNCWESWSTRFGKQEAAHQSRRKLPSQAHTGKNHWSPCHWTLDTTSCSYITAVSGKWVWVLLPCAWAWSPVPASFHHYLWMQKSQGCASNWLSLLGLASGGAVKSF